MPTFNKYLVKSCRTFPDTLPTTLLAKVVEIRGYSTRLSYIPQFVEIILNKSKYLYVPGTQSLKVALPVGQWKPDGHMFPVIPSRGKGVVALRIQ